MFRRQVSLFAVLLAFSQPLLPLWHSLEHAHETHAAHDAALPDCGRPGEAHLHDDARDGGPAESHACALCPSFRSLAGLAEAGPLPAPIQATLSFSQSSPSPAFRQIHAGHPHRGPPLAS